MKLIFGLGNPGSKYDGTRHNTGFSVLDAFAQQNELEFSEKSKFKAFIAEGSVDAQKFLLVKPTTYYNQAGESYRLISDFYKIEPQDTLIIHDELALPFAKVRSRIGGSDAGNNGIKNINLHGGDNSARVRIGIANEMRTTMGDVDFVLARYSQEESAKLTSDVEPAALSLIEKFLKDHHQVTSQTL